MLQCFQRDTMELIIATIKSARVLSLGSFKKPFQTQTIQFKILFITSLGSSSIFKFSADSVQYSTGES